MRQAGALAGQERVQPRQPARRHRRCAVAAMRAGQHRKRSRSRQRRRSRARRWPTRSSGLGSLALARIGRLIQGPGSVAGGHTPSARPPSTTTSDRLQPRFQQAPDEHARMFGGVLTPAQGAAAAHHRAFQQRVQQAGQGGEAAGRAVASSASCASASNVASASPSSCAHSRAGPAAASVAASASAASHERGEGIGGRALRPSRRRAAAAPGIAPAGRAGCARLASPVHDRPGACAVR